MYACGWGGGGETNVVCGGLPPTDSHPVFRGNNLTSDGVASGPKGFPSNINLIVDI